MTTVLPMTAESQKLVFKVRINQKTFFFLPSVRKEFNNPIGFFQLYNPFN